MAFRLDTHTADLGFRLCHCFLRDPNSYPIEIQRFDDPPLALLAIRRLFSPGWAEEELFSRLTPDVRKCNIPNCHDR
jgi:hypothetical protein